MGNWSVGKTDVGQLNLIEQFIIVGIVFIEIAFGLNWNLKSTEPLTRCPLNHS